MSDIDALFAANRRSEGLPIIKFKEVNDGFQGTVLGWVIRDIPNTDKSKPPTTTLIIELELDEPRTQIKNVEDKTTGMLVPQEITGTKWSWFVKANSQALTELENAMGPNRRPGSPLRGDRLRVKLIGLKPTKFPQPAQVVKIQFKPSGVPEVLAKALVEVPQVAAPPGPSLPEEYTEDDVF